MRFLSSVLLSLLFTGMMTACSTDTDKHEAIRKISPVAKTDVVLDETGQSVAVNPPLPSNEPIGGDIAKGMDSLDRAKLIRGLDKGTGKKTEWSNPITQIAYTVTPVKKLRRNENTCREYHVEAMRGNDSKDFTGVACLGPDGNWVPVAS